MRYLVIYEKSETGWGAYAPDLPGLGVAAKTLDEAKELIREAIDLHIEGMPERGDEVAPPQRDHRAHNGIKTARINVEVVAADDLLG
jgi:predicted RNase H-like HicB family nuclease